MAGLQRLKASSSPRDDAQENQEPSNITDKPLTSVNAAAETSSCHDPAESSDATTRVQAANLKRTVSDQESEATSKLSSQPVKEPEQNKAKITPTKPAKAAKKCADITPEKDAKPGDRRPGFGGTTSKCDRCWICEQPRTKYQQGSVCEVCKTLSRKQLGHQRFLELKGDQELLAKIKASSLEQQNEETPACKNDCCKKMAEMLSKFEAALDVIPDLVAATRTLGEYVSSLDTSGSKKSTRRK